MFDKTVKSITMEVKEYRGCGVRQLANELSAKLSRRFCVHLSRDKLSVN